MLTYSLKRNFYTFNQNQLKSVLNNKNLDGSKFYKKIKGGKFMTIVDIEQKAYEELKWYATRKFKVQPNSFKNPSLYSWNSKNVDAVPDIVNIRSNPKILLTSVQVLSNDTSIQQSQTLKFSQKCTETTTTSTTTGYKIGTSIKSTTKGKIKVGFLIAGEIEQSVEVSLTGEYNHSTTKTTTSTHEELWEYTQPVLVPARSKVIATFYIMGGPVTIPMTLSANIAGTGVSPKGSPYHLSKIYFKEQNFSNNSSLSARASVLYNPNWPGYSPVFTGVGENYSLNVEGASVSANTVGLYSYVEFKEYPLSADTVDIDAVPMREYYSTPILRNGTTALIPTDSFNPRFASVDHNAHSMSKEE